MEHCGPNGLAQSLHCRTYLHIAAVFYIVNGQCLKVFLKVLNSNRQD